MEISLSFHYKNISELEIKGYITQFLKENDLDEYTIIPYTNQFTALRIYLPQMTEREKEKLRTHIQQTFEKHVPFIFNLVSY